MRSRASSPGRPLSDTKVSGRRVTCKAPLAHLEGESDRSEVSPTAILQSTHSLEGVSLLKKSVEGLWMDLNRVQRPKKWCRRGQKRLRSGCRRVFQHARVFPEVEDCRPPCELLCLSRVFKRRRAPREVRNGESVRNARGARRHAQLVGA